MRYCIYFLVRDGKVTYIGHTNHIQMRVRGHSLHKIFDYVRWIPCKDKAAALHYEKRWQAKFLPVENINGTKPDKIKKARIHKMLHINPEIEVNKNRVRVHFSLDKEEYQRALQFAEKDGRTLGNYITWCLIRGLRNDAIIMPDFMEDSMEMRIIKNG
jgi:hypothetical protein